MTLKHAWNKQQLITVALVNAIEWNDGLIDAHTSDSIYGLPSSSDQELIDQWKFEIDGWKKILQERTAKGTGNLNLPKRPPDTGKIISIWDLAKAKPQKFGEEPKDD